jgi:hypothetical protein
MRAEADQARSLGGGVDAREAGLDLAAFAVVVGQLFLDAPPPFGAMDRREARILGGGHLCNRAGRVGRPDCRLRLRGHQYAGCAQRAQGRVSHRFRLSHVRFFLNYVLADISNSNIYLQRRHLYRNLGRPDVRS